MGDLLEGMLGGHLVWWVMINLPRASPELTSNYSNSSREALAGHQHPSEVSQEEQFLTVPGVVGHRGHTHELKRRLPQAHLPAQKSDAQCQAWGEWPQLQKEDPLRDDATGIPSKQGPGIAAAPHLWDLMYGFRYTNPIPIPRQTWVNMLTGRGF